MKMQAIIHSNFYGDKKSFVICKPTFTINGLKSCLSGLYKTSKDDMKLYEENGMYELRDDDELLKTYWNDSVDIVVKKETPPLNSKPEPEKISSDKKNELDDNKMELVCEKLDILEKSMPKNICESGLLMAIILSFAIAGVLTLINRDIAKSHEEIKKQNIFFF